MAELRRREEKTGLPDSDSLLDSITSWLQDCRTTEPYRRSFATEIHVTCRVFTSETNERDHG
jgi:hypothetical protein